MLDFIGAKNVLSKDRLKELSVRSNAPAFVHLATHVAAIGLNSYAMAWTWGTWWCVPFFMLQGVLLNFLYAAEHECDHFTAFRSRWLNILVARVTGFVIVLTNDYHRLSHYAHHRHTQDWEKDPEILARKVFETPWDYLWVLSGLASSWGRLLLLIEQTLGRCDEWYATEAQKRTMITAARWHTTGYASIAAVAFYFESWWPLYYWIGPLVLMRWTYWLQGLGEHNGLTHEPHTLLNTRTLKTNAFMHWINWNMTYHAIHHTFPSIPFYRLPEAHREAEAKLGYELPSASYLNLHWGHLKQMFKGAGERDICEAHTKSLIDSGRIPKTL